MLSGYRKTTNIFATCEIDGNQTATFNGTIGTGGAYNVMKSVQDVQLYENNREQCDADYAEFEQRVQEEAGKE